MGALDQPSGSSAKRKIQVVNITGQTANQIENTFNNGAGAQGWRFVQAIVLGINTFAIFEKEVN